MMERRESARANGLLELTTFVAIVIGTSFGTMLVRFWRTRPLKRVGALLASPLWARSLTLRYPYGPRRPEPRNGSTGTLSGRSSPGRARTPLAEKPLALERVRYLLVLVRRRAFSDGPAAGLGEEVLARIGRANWVFWVTALAAGIGLGSLGGGRYPAATSNSASSPVGAALMGFASVALGRTLATPTPCLSRRRRLLAGAFLPFRSMPSSRKKPAPPKKAASSPPIISPTWSG